MNSESNYQEEISLKQFFLTIGRYVREIRKRWYVLVLGVALAAGIAILMHTIIPKTYPTRLTFMVENESGGAGGMLGGLLGSFGTALKPGQTNLDRVLSISTSRRIINETMLKKIIVSKKLDFIANHILELYEFDKIWKKNNRNELVGFRFTTDDIEHFSTTDHFVLKNLYKHVKEGSRMRSPLISTGQNVDAGILYFEGRTISPEMTVGILDSLYQVVSYYHEGRNIENAKHNFDLISEKVDSLSRELINKQYALASVKDRSNNIINNRDRVSAQKLELDVQMLGYAYAEGVKNREIAALELESQKSNLLVLDRPVLPIPSDHGSPLIKMIKAGIMGGVITTFLLCLLIFYRDVMATES